MATLKPPRPPTFDATAFSGRLHERVLTEQGDAYPVFDPKDDTGKFIGLPRFVQWIRGLRDVVNGNAIFLDQVKDDLDAHRAADNARHANLSNRVAALEAQQHAPFPESG